MNAILSNIFGINWRTTILGIGVIVGAVGRIVLVFRSKQYDFTALAEDGQLIITTGGALLTGVGLFIAKDAKVTGVGKYAKSVDSEGVVSNAEGEKIGKQPS